MRIRRIAMAIFGLATFAACGEHSSFDGVRNMSSDSASFARAASPGTVTNLSAAATSATAITLSFKQVGNGAGAPASYDVRYAKAPISWGPAASVTNGTCSTPLAGTATTGTLTCTVLGLSPSTKYGFQLIAFRGTLNVSATFGGLSNVAEATTPATTGAPVATTVAVAPTSASVAVGGSQTFAATVRDQTGATMPCSSLSWASQNTAVATVSATGSVNGIAAGTATITATCAPASGNATVTVTAAPPPPPPPPPGVGDTVFFENWEANSFAKWQDGYNPSKQKINTDAGAFQGSRYLDVTYSASTDGGWLNTWFMPGYDSLYVRAYFKMSNGWTGGTKFLGFMGNRTDDMWSSFGKAGICPNGTDYFAATVVTEPNGATSTLSAPVRIYSYFPSMAREPDGVTCWGRYGNGSETYTAPTQISFGVWHKIEFWVRINAVGQNNGAQKVWIDGRLEGDWPGLSFRSSTILKMNALSLMFSSINPAAQHLYVDDILVLANKPSP